MGQRETRSHVDLLRGGKEKEGGQEGREGCRRTAQVWKKGVSSSSSRTFFLQDSCLLFFAAVRPMQSERGGRGRDSLRAYRSA